MADPFVAEIRIFAGNFAPIGWATCDGQVISIQQNVALYSLIGTYFGGNGTSNFQLPNFGGTAAVGAGNGNGLTPRVLGEQGGETSVTLLTSEMPLHNHPMMAHGLGLGGGSSPVGAAPTKSSANIYATGTATPMAQQAISSAGSSMPHNNVQPFMMFTFIIALRGVFPTRG